MNDLFVARVLADAKAAGIKDTVKEMLNKELSRLDVIKLAFVLGQNPGEYIDLAGLTPPYLAKYGKGASGIYLCPDENGRITPEIYEKSLTAAEEVLRRYVEKGGKK